MDNSIKDKILRIRSKYRECYNEIQKQCSFDTYHALLLQEENEPTYEYSKLGISLHSIARMSDSNLQTNCPSIFSTTPLQNVDMIMKVLNKLSVPKDYKLEIVQQVWEDFGRCHLYMICPDGSRKDNIFDFIEVENSKMGAWQAYLLYTLWHILPLFDHSAYNRREYIFLNQDLETIYLDNKDPKEEFKGLDTNLNILQYDSVYYISCCFWSRYSGLTRELMEITIKDDRVSQFLEYNYQSMYKYGHNIRI